MAAARRVCDTRDTMWRWLFSLVATVVLAGCGGRERPRAPDGEAAGSAESTPPPHHEPPGPGRRLSSAAESSLEKAKTLPEGVERNQRLAEIAWQAVEGNPEMARRALEMLPAEHPERILLIQHLAMRQAESDPDKALASALDLSSESERSAAVGRIAVVISENDPVRAAGLLSDHGTAGRDLDVSLVQVIRRWAGKDPAAAAAWTSSFPAGEFRKASWDAVFTPWLAGDPSAALGWFSKIDDPDLRGEALRSLAAALRAATDEVRAGQLAKASPSIRSEIEAALRITEEP